MSKYKFRAKSTIKRNMGVEGGKIKEPESTESGKASVLELFQFATPTDILLIIIGSICSVGNGMSRPLLYLIFSNIIGLFATHQDASKGEGIYDAGVILQQEVNLLCVKFLIIGLVTFIAAYLQSSLWSIFGERQALKIRDIYYKSVLSQDMGWFDSVSSGEVAIRLAGDTDKIQEGLSEKVGLLIQYLTTFIGGIIIALIRGWKLTLVMMSIVPLLISGGVLSGKIIAKSSSQSIGSYGKANAIAAEVLGAIRTVYSFNGVPKEVERYSSAIDKARLVGLRKSMVTGVGSGFVMALMFLSYALAMWYGGQLILNDEYKPENVLVVFLNVLVGSMSLGQTAPSLEAISNAQGAASTILSVIYRQSNINPFALTNSMTATQKSMAPVEGNVEFKNVVFAYPNRQDKIVLNNVSFSVPVGKTVALVGFSGSGKSTTIGLLERFYDPQSGSIHLDGVDIRTISTSFLRNHIGLVGQEPTLFATTIKNNLLFGLSDDALKYATQDLIENACKSANIHNFIMKLPNGYDTLVGEKGSQLSGGQKQRIAIARAIIKNPPILLLDEATSALDTESERTVQRALESASANRTTIVIAHRLSTIQHADTILVFDKGNIVERGTHSELVSLGGIYADLVAQQTIFSGNENINRTMPNIESIDLTASSDLNQSEKKSGEIVMEVNEVNSKNHNLNSDILSQNKISTQKKLSYLRVLKLSKPWLSLFILGTFGAILDGAIFPVYSLLLTRVTQSFLDASSPDTAGDGLVGINFWATMFVVLSITCFISGFLKVGILSMLGEHITFFVRKKCFVAMTQQDMEFYDDPANSLGTLTARLSTEADQVQALISKVYGTWVSAFSSVVLSLSLAFSSGWKLALVVIACIPFTTFAQIYKLSTASQGSSKNKLIYQEVSQLVMDSIVQIRTLASLSKEDLFYKKYREGVESAHKLAVRGFLQNSIVYGISMASPHFVNALVFWYGTTLVVKGEYKYQNMFQVISAVIFMGINIGFVSAEIGTLVKSKLAAREVFDLWDRNPTINEHADYGNKTHKLYGNIALQKAEFSYPTRRDVPILQGLDLNIMANKKVALVGASGSGKSTIIALVQRFYNLDSGSMKVEGLNICEWNVPHLRSGMAVVGQEPVLFDMSIEDNIRYGAKDPNSITSEEIYRVAILANAHDFISMLPEGYKTQIGERGGQISGGQKQRIAIARALIRNPALLLLDEATSALDSQSESVVQSALDNASKNRTTIIIAHRLSTVQNSDLIIAMQNGKVVESGTHNELLSHRGYYYSLVNSQSL